MTKVSLVNTTNRAEGVSKAIKLLQYNPVKGKVVTLKPNFNSADACPGSTHIDTLRALILNLKEMGAKKIVLAERSGPGDTTHNIMEKKGVFALAQEIGFDIVNLEELPPEGWFQITPKVVIGRPGSRFRGFILRPNVSCRPAVLKLTSLAAITPCQ